MMTRLVKAGGGGGGGGGGGDFFAIRNTERVQTNDAKGGEESSIKDIKRGGREGVYSKIKASGNVDNEGLLGRERKEEQVELETCKHVGGIGASFINEKARIIDLASIVRHSSSSAELEQALGLL